MNEQMKEFEAWALDYGLDCDTVHGNVSVRYLHDETQFAFDAWLGARGLVRRGPDVVAI